MRKIIRGLDLDLLATVSLFAFMITFMIWLKLPVATSSVQPPLYSALVQISDENGRVGFANAFLVDKELGLLVTNAHVMAEGKRWQIKLGKRIYLVESHKDWINPSADVAIIRLVKYAPENLPLAAQLSGSVYVGLIVQARGYKRNEKNYCAEGKIIDLEVEKYWIIADGGWWNWLKTNTIRPGCSGSAVLGPDGRVVGIVSAASRTWRYGYFVRSREIKKLLKQVQLSLKQPVALGGRLSF